MRKLVVTEFVSLDGVMEDPGGAEKFEHGGWTRPYWGDDIGKFKWDELFASDALLLGRVTYEGFAKAWPKMTDEFANKMNGVAHYVVSTTLTKTEWQNSTIIRGNVAQEVMKLKQMPGQDILVGGSARLVQTLLQNDLVDVYRLLVYPVVLGSGKRLFGGGTSKLQLVQATTFKSGVVGLVYQTWKAQ